MPQYTHLSKNEREIIDAMLAEWASQKKIADTLERDEWTVSREIQRNKTLKAWKWAKKNKEPEDYRYCFETAHAKATERASVPRVEAFSAFQYEPLMTYVITHMKTPTQWEAWSPDIITWTLKKEHVNDERMHISHEHLYQFIYSPWWEALGLKHNLLRAHKRRKKQTGRSVSKPGEKTKVPHRIDITERPPEIETRLTFGHYEGDSILSGQKQGAVLHTEVERLSRFILAQQIPRKTALLTFEAQKDMFSRLPPAARRTSTYDNGTENTLCYKLKEELGMDVYYAKPYHSWERGSNEHGNGMIRRFFPKWTDFSTLTQADIDKVIDIINRRPRKILWYKSAHEVFYAHLSALL
jgi:transposase, IS30 family